MPVFSLSMPRAYSGALMPCEAVRLPPAALTAHCGCCPRNRRVACHARQASPALPKEPGFFPGAKAAAELFLNGAPDFAAATLPCAPAKARPEQRP